MDWSWFVLPVPWVCTDRGDLSANEKKKINGLRCSRRSIPMFNHRCSNTIEAALRPYEAQFRMPQLPAACCIDKNLRDNWT